MASLVSPTVGRADAGSLTLPAPSKTISNADHTAPSQEVAACGGNTQLMEARLCELTSSIRALLRSNTDLEDALAGGNEDDPDFLQALEENNMVVRRQGRVAVALVQELKNHGCNISLEADVQQALLDISTVVMAENDGEVAEGRNGTPASETNNSAGTPAVSGIFL